MSVNDFSYSTAAPFLGFNITTNYNTSQTSDSSYNIHGPNYIMLKSVFLTSAVNRKTIYANNTYANVLAVIPVIVEPGDMISISDPNLIPLNLSYKFTIHETDIIDFTFTDDTGSPLNLDGSPTSIELIFTTS